MEDTIHVGGNQSKNRRQERVKERAKQKAERCKHSGGVVWGPVQNWGKMIIGEKDEKQKRLEDMAGWHLIEGMDTKELGKVRTDAEFRGCERL